ncbi:TIGR04141 family sporadically distributed protein [Paraburkholderia sp. BL21I4N1]|uniref:TIGR04141 family sporadically distributed protein n=1 Tax=Paraburkholderia sp. BL21I4N1 TaxID=1938801 RepID=UPI0015E2840D|nr:TIGR04141 family sporadically distributed protein [Paraburkholderia sp. BL21I4N1]
MNNEKKVNHLSVFLIKPQYTTAEQVVDGNACEPPVDIPITGCGNGRLYIKKSPPKPPKWASLFQGYVDLGSLAMPGVSAVFFLPVGERCFALAFGHAGRFLLRDEVWEERFGLLCALNLVDPKSFRCVDVQSLDAIQSHTRIQSGQETTPEQFGLNVEQDMLKAIVGAPLNHALGNRVTGSDSLLVSVKMDLADLPFLLDEYRKKFETQLSVEDYQWVNNMSMVANSVLVGTLDAALNEKLATGQVDDIWLSIPEIIDWTMVKGFMYTQGGKEIHSDINLKGFLSTVKHGTPLTLDLLRSRHVHCADADHNKVFKSWPIFKCLYSEVDLSGVKYILSDGKWFKVATDFVAKTNAEFSTIPYSGLKLSEYTGNGEGAYNSMVAAAEPSIYALLDDKKKVMHGGGHGQVEICDLFSIDREFIHVKLYSKSSVLSHLFAQGFVSGQLIQIDADFRSKARARLDPPHKELIQIDKRPAQDEFTIVYAIISEAAGDKLHLPFFSRVNLNNTRRLLVGYGYKVELLKISVDDTYVKTVAIPPKHKASGS